LPAGFVRPGEVLELRLSYGILGTAGTTRIESSLEESPEGPRYHINITSKTRGLVDFVYSLTNNSESVFDAATGRPIKLTVSGHSGGKVNEQSTTFDYTAGKAVHVDNIRPDRNATIPLPAEPAYDLIVAMLQARTWGLRPGESRRVGCVNDADFFTVEVKAVREEVLKTPAGKFETVVLEPHPIDGKIGFFRKGGWVRVWISREAEPQIVRLDTKFKYGTIVAVLAKPPTRNTALEKR
jgi:hypothetical protein